MYNGGYDDMVVAKTSIRSRIESENAQREKKIAQLNEFIARFSAGTRSAQATSRKKEVERLQTAELARSNIARPYIRFQMDQHSGRHPLEFKSVVKSYDGVKVIHRFSASVARGEKIALIGRNGSGKTTLSEIADSQCAGPRRKSRHTISDRFGHGAVGAQRFRRLFCAGSFRDDSQGRHRDRMASRIRSRRDARETCAD